MKQKNQIKPPVLKRILQFSKPYTGYLVGALISAVVSISLTMYAPILIGKGVDLIIGKGNVDFQGLVPILTMLAGVVVCSAVFQWLMTICTNRITYQTVRDLRIAVFDRLEKVPLKMIDGHSHGDLISRLINDIDSISDGLLQGFSQLFTGIVTILATLVFMVSINLSIAAVVVIITPLSLFVATFVAKKSFRLFREQSAVRGELSGYVEEMVGSQKTIQAFGYENRAEQEFREINARLYTSGVKSQFYSSVTNPSTRFVNGIVSAAVGIFGALTVIRGGLSVGQLTSFLTYANQYTKPFNEISGVVTELQTAFASARRVFAILDEPVEPADAPNAIEQERCSGEVTIEQVSFSYHPERELIKDLNVHANPGERIAIVGPTGCGKTTMINLLMRFYDVDAGEIKVDGTPVKQMTRNSLRGLYGMVLQDTWMFEGSVRENIAYGKPDATEEEVIAAAKSAHAHGFIKRLPQGYDTVITENGGNLSQGQKQLLCIARVMLTKPPMLILDEATSSIDTRTEIRIQKAFQKMMEGRTSFIVAHRLSTIKEADHILVMKNGSIIEQGQHDDLIAKNGLYAKLYHSQFAHSK